MGIDTGIDEHGPYFVNSSNGRTKSKHKFYFVPGSTRSMQIAYNKARKQQAAMFANHFHSKKK